MVLESFLLIWMEELLIELCYQSIFISRVLLFCDFFCPTTMDLQKYSIIFQQQNKTIEFTGTFFPVPWIGIIYWFAATILSAKNDHWNFKCLNYELTSTLIPTVETLRHLTDQVFNAPKKGRNASLLLYLQDKCQWNITGISTETYIVKAIWF